MALQTAADQSISAWRDYDEAVTALRDSMSMGTWALTPGARISADELFAAGARRVTFHEVIDTGSADAAGTVRALTLIRDLTACGVVVGWELCLGASQDWRELSHLYPPASIAVGGGSAGAGLRAEWASEYLLTKCVARRGPGLLEIRDRRFGDLRKITVAGPDYLAAIAVLEHGAPADDVPSGILREFRAQRLAGPVGGMAWWLPYRVRRYACTPRLM
jgi:Family of unknown function (DUF5825)